MKQSTLLGPNSWAPDVITLFVSSIIASIRYFIESYIRMADVTVLCFTGMAGSGKTTLMQQIETQLRESSTPCYILNLDPAVYKITYSPNVDIRDTVRSLGVFSGL